MPLQINGVDGNYPVPRVLSAKYKFTAFEPTLKIQVTTGGRADIKEINVKNKILEAWNFVTNKAANHKPCNDYFKTLFRRKTLKEVLNEGNIILHCLEPKENFNSNDLPDANTAGRDIGIFPGFLLDLTPAKLSCTLVHELAHVAGATTDPGAQNAIAAEESLKHCLCADQFRKEALGRFQKIKIERYGGSRIV